MQELAEKKLLVGAMSRLDELMKKAGVKDENTILEYMISRLGKEMQGEVPDFAKRAVIKKILGVRGISTLDILRKIDGPERKNFKHYLSKPGQIELLNKSVSPLESNMVMFVFESLRAMRSALMMEGSQEAKKLSKNIENVIKEAHNASMTESIRSLKRGLSELAVVERYFKKNIDFAYNESKYSVKMCETPIREMLKLFKGNSKQHSQHKK